jgi:hypothetical protein
VRPDVADGQLELGLRCLGRGDLQLPRLLRVERRHEPHHRSQAAQLGQLVLALCCLKGQLEVRIGETPEQHAGLRVEIRAGGARGRKSRSSARVRPGQRVHVV